MTFNMQKPSTSGAVPWESVLKLVHPLTDVDQSVSRKYVHRMFVFDFPDTSNNAKEAARSTILSGMKYALGCYPFMTGRVGPLNHPSRNRLYQLRYGDTEELRAISGDTFRCVSYKQTPSDNYEELCKRGMPVSHFTKQDYCASFKWDANASEPWKPAFTLQATFLDDGALILAFAFQHTIADGYTVSLFLDKFAEGARGNKSVVEYVPPDVSGYFKTTTEVENDRDKPEMEWDLHEPRWGSRDNVPTSTMVYRFEAKEIERLTIETNIYISSNWGKEAEVTAQDCICAVFWNLILRARQHRLAREEYSRVSIAVNARPRLEPPVPNNYFGNMFATARVQIAESGLAPECEDAKPAAMEVEDIALAADAIRDAIKRVDDLSVRHRLTQLAGRACPADASKAAAIGLSTFHTTARFGSLVHFGADIDFGIPGTGGGTGGRPRWCRKPWLTEQGTVNILPRRGGTKGDEDWEVLICLGYLDMPRFQRLMGSARYGTRSTVDDFNPADAKFGEKKLGDYARR